MADTLTVEFQDGDGFKTERQYEVKAGETLDEAAIDAFLDTLQPITNLKVVKATYSREISYTPSQEPEAGSRVAITASLTCKKANSKPHTLNLPDPKASLKVGKVLKVTDNAYKNMVECFDNGLGVADQKGDYWVSDGEELLTNGIISGTMNRYNHKI